MKARLLGTIVGVTIAVAGLAILKRAMPLELLDLAGLMLISIGFGLVHKEHQG